MKKFSSTIDTLLSQLSENDIQTPQNQQDVISTLKGALAKGATFASFYYAAKGTGAEGIYTVNFNVDYKRAKDEDLERLRDYEPENELEAQAKDSILNPKARVQRKATDTYTTLGKGIRINNNNGAIHIFGFPVNYESIKAGAPKPGLKGELPIAKRELKKKLGFKSDRIRDFIVDPAFISGLKLKGNLIQFQPASEAETVAPTTQDTPE